MSYMSGWDWSVDQIGDDWWLRASLGVGLESEWGWKRVLTERREVRVAPAETPMGIAIDAACEFMDRFRLGDDADRLMSACVRNSWRQR